jgi:ethanolamine ammonia-lyase small subunit
MSGELDAGPLEPDQDVWAPLRRTTQARIGLGRAGNSAPIAAELQFRAAHAMARDAVHIGLDVGALTAQLHDLGLGDPIVVASQAMDRAQYLRRPDLGRLPASGLEHVMPAEAPDVVIVLADGLSPQALIAHGAPLYARIAEEIGGRFRMGAPVIATQARVALGDHVGLALGARAVIMLIGERPGLSVAQSIGIYLTWGPRPGRTDAERNCISNVHPPDGLGYADAARVVAALLIESSQLGESGVRVKDRSAVGGAVLDQAPPQHPSS